MASQVVVGFVCDSVESCSISSSSLFKQECSNLKCMHAVIVLNEAVVVCQHSSYSIIVVFPVSDQQEIH